MSNKTLPALRPTGPSKGHSAPLSPPTPRGNKQSPIRRHGTSFKGDCSLQHGHEDLKKLDEKVDMLLRKVEDLRQDLIASTTLTTMVNKGNNSWASTTNSPSAFSPGHGNTAESGFDRLVGDVMRPDALSVFANNIEKIYEFWKMLHTMTNVPSDAQDTNAFIFKAFQFIDNAMANQEFPHQLCRLTHVALTNMITRFKRIVAADRRKGKIQSRSGYRNAAVVMDLYLDAQGSIADRVHAKRQLNRRIQTSRRWTELARGCPLLLVAYSDEAERLMFVPPPS
ncbi:hypothetical protein F53441_8302 [Fusarium austroafricanum]|uniref:Uncharacterized protein n=1 Tax=Fusarium austroafricanum TaxID=2364996 RepID=A0A8H4KER4_9HYPO|nr:hypothetical protein F53441_8302 [Fusarium austroafricanum]